MGFPIEFVISEAKSRGFSVERLAVESKLRAHDPRLLLIDGRRCQIIPCPRLHSNASYPQAQYSPLYLPRTPWADFLVYVAHKETPRRFYIIPRGELTKDTGRSIESLARFQDAWEWLQTNSDAKLDRNFETLSWQLQTVITQAQNAGQSVDLFPTKKAQRGRKWPATIKRRVMIAGRRCALFTATRICKDESKSEYNYVFLRASAGKWAEFNLYILDADVPTADVLIIPRGLLLATTTCSLDHREVAKYVNRWDLLSARQEELAAMKPIQWRDPKPVKTPSKHSIVLQAVIREAERCGLTVETQCSDSPDYRGVQSCLSISKRRCQIIWSNPKVAGASNYAVSMSVPRSSWAEFLVFYVSLPDGDQVKYYVIPRADLPHSTSYSMNSRRLTQYDGAWDLLNSR